MTRINVVPPQELHNKHLMAEYVELPRIFEKVLAKPYRTAHVIPPTYRLGTGHMKFFYDKCAYLIWRWCIIRQELLARGYNLDLEKSEYVLERIAKLPAWSLNNYEPTEVALIENRVRLQVRMPK